MAPPRALTLAFVSALAQAAWSAEPREVTFGRLTASIAADGTFSLQWAGTTIVAHDFASGVVRFDSADVDVHVTRDDVRAVVTTGIKGDYAFAKRTIILRDTDCIITWRLVVLTDEPLADGQIGFFLPRRLLRDANFHALDRVGDYHGRQVQEVDDPKLIEVDGPVPFEMRFACSPGPGQADAGWAFRDDRSIENAWRQAVAFGANPPGGELTAVARFDFVPPDENWEALAECRQEKGNLYVDYLDLVEHPFTFTLERSSKYVIGSAPVTVACDYLSADSAPRKLDATYLVTDYYGRQVSAGGLDFGTRGAPSAGRSVKVATKTLGMCRFVLTFRDEESGFEGSRETVWAVLPPQEERGYLPSSLFGAHIARSDYYYTLAQAMGVRWTRLHGAGGDYTAWSAVEPEEGRWEWPSGLRSDALAARHKIAILGLLDSPPKWAEPGFADDYGGFLTQWAEYAQRTVAFLTGTVEHWEVWNEPYQAFADRPADYAELLRRTYEAAKQADPACTIVGTCGPPAYMPLDWYIETFKPFGLQYQDAVSAHLYPPTDGLRGSELQLPRWIAEIRRRQLASGAPKPIWNTEAGIRAPGSYFRHPNHRPLIHLSANARPVPAEDVAGCLVRQYVPCLAGGVRYFYYALAGGPDYALHLCEYDGTPMPACVAYAQLASVLQTAEYVRDLSMPQGIQAYLFAVGYTPVAIAWGTDLGPGESADLQIALPRGGARVLDLMGNEAAFRSGKRGHLTLTGQPTYVIGDKMTVAEMGNAFSTATIREWRRKPAAPPGPPQPTTP